MTSVEFQSPLLDIGILWGEIGCGERLERFTRVKAIFSLKRLCMCSLTQISQEMFSSSVGLLFPMELLFPLSALTVKAEIGKVLLSALLFRGRSVTLNYTMNGRSRRTDPISPKQRRIELFLDALSLAGLRV